MLLYILPATCSKCVIVNADVHFSCDTSVPPPGMTNTLFYFCSRFVLLFFYLEQSDCEKHSVQDEIIRRIAELILFYTRSMGGGKTLSNSCSPLGPTFFHSSLDMASIWSSGTSSFSILGIMTNWERSEFVWILKSSAASSIMSSLEQLW